MANTNPNRRRAAHLGPERRRPQVLDAALAIAVEQGVAAVTIGAVAHRMNVTRPVVYACFADRVELIEALLQREEDHLLGGALGALPDRDADAPESVFVEGYQDFLAAVAARPDAWRLVFTGEPDPPLANRFARTRAELIDRATQLIAPSLRRWGTPDAERKLPILVELFISAGEAAARALLREDNTWGPDELGEFVGRAVYRAFKEA
jgi:AcrR family transcriptional regulator